MLDSGIVSMNEINAVTIQCEQRDLIIGIGVWLCVTDVCHSMMAGSGGLISVFAQ
jgi:hypothetical protein